MGSLFLQLLLQAVYARGTGAKRSYLLAVDEFFHLLEAPGLTKRFETALTTTRSFGLSLMLIHHNFAQLPTGLREIILGNCDLMALFRTGARNADFFGDFLPTVAPDLLAKTGGDGRRPSRDEIRRHQLEGLQRLPDRTCFWYDRRRPHRAIRMRVPDVEPPHQAARLAGPAFEDAIRREGWATGAAAVPREHLKREIRDRQERLKALLRPPVRVSEPALGEDAAPEAKGSRTKAKRPRLG